MGALEFEPAQDTFLEKDTKIEIDSLVEVAREALNQKAELDTNLSQDRKEALLNIIKVGTSAGGQRAKAVIAFNEKTQDVRSWPDVKGRCGHARLSRCRARVHHVRQLRRLIPRQFSSYNNPSFNFERGIICFILQTIYV